MQTRMTALFRQAAAGELPFGEKGRKAMAIAMKKKIAKQRYRTDVCAMRPAISVLSFSVFSGCLKVSKHQKTISGFRPQNREHPQYGQNPKESPTVFGHRAAPIRNRQKTIHPQRGIPRRRPLNISSFLYRYAKTGACAGERSRGGGLEGEPLLKRRPLQGLPLQ